MTKVRVMMKGGVMMKGRWLVVFGFLRILSVYILTVITEFFLEHYQSVYSVKH